MTQLGEGMLGTRLVPRSLLAELHSRAIYLHLRCLLCAVLLLLRERRAHVLVIAIGCIIIYARRERRVSESGRVWVCVWLAGAPGQRMCG